MAEILSIDFLGSIVTGSECLTVQDPSSVRTVICKVIVCVPTVCIDCTHVGAFAEGKVPPLNDH